MREIKFRVWNNKQKKMYDWETLIGKKGIGIFTWIEAQNNNLFKNNILMQYIGLKDKNGKEIYELMELNKCYIVIYILAGYFLYDIFNNQIKTFQEVFYGNEPEITKEYRKISKNEKRHINEYIQSSKIKKYC